MRLFEISGAWDRETVESFLDDQTIPIRLGYRQPGNETWMVSLWFRYHSGEILCATKSNARVVKDLRDYPHCSFEISTNDPPYKGIRGKGEVQLERDRDKATLRALIKRYLGDTDSDLAKKLLAEDREETRIRILPETVYSWDFTGRMPEPSKEQN